MLGDVQQLGRDAANLAATAVWTLADDELVSCLQVAYRAEQAVATLQARLTHQATVRGLPTRQGERGTTAWLRSLVPIDPGPARELADRADALARHPVLEQALIDGHLDGRQATAIAAATDNVATGLAELRAADLQDPADQDPAAAATAAAEIVREAEATLIGMADRLPAYQLRSVGERVLSHVAPHLAERAEEMTLARQEERAHRARGFTLSAPVAGTVRLSGMVGVEDAALVQAALHPLCNPIAEDERRPAQRRADALVEVCRLAMRTAELPQAGGEPAQLAVTVAYNPLTQTLGAATTDSGARLPAEAVRRLACDARILPVVLGTAGQVLDLGRTHRLATSALRRALAVRDGGCAFPDCDRPARWTDAHHMIAWTAGGATCLDNLVLLCRHHHRLIHHPLAGWRVRLGPDRLPEFLPPPSVDPDQQPRRNLFHQRE
ncbi:HNH endonuclease [Actinoplanes sp. TRM 88003]|uniref:HNH endonuclease n=1 Tax=Paractinoplanes aksuensis TaxID=2939490 RepID=A0ABT1DPY4_9ACTN|nr:HNH endonuclease [Actinoplanes aksuensis]